MVVQMANGGFNFGKARHFVANLKDELMKLNPTGCAFLEERLGQDFSELQSAVSALLILSEKHAILFDAHKGDNAMVATLKDVANMMGKATDQSLVWSDVERPRRQSRNSWKLTHAVLDMSSTTNDQSDGHREVDNIESSIFICCARADAIQHARVLRSELSMKLGRGCVIGGSTDAAAFIGESQLFLVLLTRQFLIDPIALSEVWSALQFGLPITTVAVTGVGYDYSEAATAYADLPTALERAQPGAAMRLQELLPEGTTVAAAGEKLGANLTSIIAISWSPLGSKNQTEAVVSDIIARIPRKMRGRPQSRRSFTRGVEATPASTTAIHKLKGSPDQHSSV